MQLLEISRVFISGVLVERWFHNDEADGASRIQSRSATAAPTVGPRGAADVESKQADGQPQQRRKPAGIDCTKLWIGLEQRTSEVE